ncbi:hypothetical protein NLJ89_g95 [Agrocybe chaxingu]|uniref:Uncharacterized protein n=1 Tax=Agrocybe chaxingu TaxID=84603 RepID=A0A9W8TFE5_9AGAR|nr:hypothetical protein NLJ89_g95 [Agrocybe chaxingu]
MLSHKRRREEFDDEDEDEAAYGKQILPVANLPYNFDDEPMDGMQYLFTVRRDARQLPDIVRVPNPYEKLESLLDVSTPDGQTSSGSPCLPSEEWRGMFELRFQNFRKNFSQPTIHVGPANEPTRRLMPDKKDRDLWWEFLSGKPESQWAPPKVSKAKSKRQPPPGMRAWADEPEQNHAATSHIPWHSNDEGEVEQVLKLDPAESLPSPVGTPVPLGYLEDPHQLGAGPVAGQTLKQSISPREPTTTLLKLIDERMALHLLMYFAHWIQQHLNAPESSVYLPLESHARWMFALLSRINDYISADDMNLLRNLARACLALLKAIKREQKTRSSQTIQLCTEGKMGETSCWIIITTVAEIWKQRDIWIDAHDMLTQV